METAADQDIPPPLAPAMVRDRLDEMKLKAEISDKEMAKSKSAPDPVRDGDVKAYLDEIQVLEGRVGELKEQVDRMKRLQSELLASVVQERALKQELEGLDDDVKRKSTGLWTEVKRIKEQHRVLDPEQLGGEPTSDQRLKVMQLKRLIGGLQSVMEDWRAAQLSFEEKSKAKLRRQLNIIGETKTDEELQELLDSRTGGADIFAQGLLKDTERARLVLRDVNARGEEIFSLENQIRQVNDLYRELNLLVAEQGEVINHVDQNLEQAHACVESGNVQLVRAKRSKKKSRKICCIVAISVVVLLAIVGAILATSLA